MSNATGPSNRTSTASSRDSRRSTPTSRSTSRPRPSSRCRCSRATTLRAWRGDAQLAERARRRDEHCGDWHQSEIRPSARPTSCRARRPHLPRHFVHGPDGLWLCPAAPSSGRSARWCTPATSSRCAAYDQQLQHEFDPFAERQGLFSRRVRMRQDERRRLSDAHRWPSRTSTQYATKRSRGPRTSQAEAKVAARGPTTKAKWSGRPASS